MCYRSRHRAGRQTVRESSWGKKGETKEKEKKIEINVARGFSREGTNIRRPPGHDSYVFPVVAESIAIDASNRPIEANRVTIRRFENVDRKRWPVFRAWKRVHRTAYVALVKNV